MSGFIVLGEDYMSPENGSTRTIRLTSLDGAPSLARMPNIRDVVQALGSREGVDGVILLGRDGLTIDSFVSGDLDIDSVSALVPSVAESCTRVGFESGREKFTTCVVEYTGGLAIVAQLTAETLLAVLVRPNVNVGNFLFDLRRHRGAIAALL